MTPHDEHLLYLNNRAAWARYVAPSILDKMLDSDDEKYRLWDSAGPELRDELRKLTGTPS